MNILAFDLSNIGSLLLFVVIIAFLIAWHELGHLLVAKKCNVYCYEYAIGFGPAIYKNKKRETHFTIRAIPLGGFVKMAGEEGVEEGEVVKGNNGEEIPSNRILANQSLWKRALVMAAGGIMNIIMALLCFYIVITVNGGFQIPSNSNDVYISLPVDGNECELAKAGMETDDIITKVEIKLADETEYKVYEITNYKDIINALNEKVPEKVENNAQDIKISYLDVSDNNTLKVAEVERKWVNVDDNLQLSKIGLEQNRTVYEYNALTATYGSFHFMGYYTVEICKAFGGLFVGKFENLSGLVGIYSTIDSVATAPASFGVRLINIISIIGSISFSLGFFNLIPFPALDGGRLVFVAIEAITKKKVNPNVEGTIHFVGIILLFALMIIINIRDVINLF